MTGHLRHVMTIQTTPQELREIADLMESKWPRLKIGDSTIVATRVIDGNELCFAVDQEKMTKLSKRLSIKEEADHVGA